MLFPRRGAELCHRPRQQHSGLSVMAYAISPYRVDQSWQTQQKPLTCRVPAQSGLSSMQMQFAREQMIEQQLRAWDVLDNRVLDTLRAIPRERFVPEAWRELAFADCEIALPGGKRMLRPMIVGRILQELSLRGGEEVLEVGTGSGYLSACLSRLGGRVRSLELHAELAQFARANLQATVPTLPCEVVVADGMELSEESRYDIVVVTA